MNETDVSNVLHQRSRASGRVDEHDREIRLVGEPILALNPATNSHAVPEFYRDHELVRGRFFYTLPSQVLDAVTAQLGEEHFDPELLAMERQLAKICGDHSSTVGFWRGSIQSYHELRPGDVPDVSEEDAREVGLDAVKLNHALRVHRERNLLSLQRFARGYCGWLLTNRQFHDEHDALLVAHADTIRCWGVQPLFNFHPELQRAEQQASPDTTEPPDWNSMVQDAEQFLLRWRLAALAGPFLPVPAKPLMAGVFPPHVVQRMMGSGGVFYLPDTMPVPSRDQLRVMLDGALHRGEKQEHLAEWFDIVRSDNSARNQMDPFARLFELQHYWRILHQRHANAIYRRIGKLKSAFAAIFSVRTEQISQDLTAIRKRLGGDWLERTVVN